MEVLFDTIFSKRQNIFLSGTGGCGKSYTLKQIFLKAKEHKIVTEITSTTGISAYHIAGRTIHSWAGFILPGYITEPDQFDREIKKAVDKVKKNSTIRDRWMKTQLLLIDEISMMGGNYFDMLNCVGKFVRNNSAPFGGIQLVLSGDLLQLPPVRDILIFQSGTWDEINFKAFVLCKPWRFNDAQYIELLQRIRTFSQTKNDIELLKSRCADNFDQKYLEEFYKDAVIVLPLKKDVDRYNRDRLNSISSELTIITSTDNTYKKNEAPKVLEEDKGKNLYKEIVDQDYKSDESKKSTDSCCICLNDFETGDRVKYLPCFHMFHSNEIDEWLDRNDSCPLCKRSVKEELLKLENKRELSEFKTEENKNFENIFPCQQYLYLKHECKVMLLINLDVKLGLVNGSVGTVKNISRQSIRVDFNGLEIDIVPHEFVYEDYDVVLTRRQFPLVLSYALSIHKCQGSTIDKIVVDLGKNIFAEGQAYVALSRCKNLNSVVIKEFYTEKLKSNKEAIDVEKKLAKKAIYI